MVSHIIMRSPLACTRRGSESAAEDHQKAPQSPLPKNIFINSVRFPLRVLNTKKTYVFISTIKHAAAKVKKVAGPHSLRCAAI